MKNTLLLVLFITAMTCAFSQEIIKTRLTGKYLGQPEPGLKPELFAPGIVSTGMSELNSVFSPDGSEFYFCVRISQISSLFRMQMRSAVWSKPELLPFASRYGDVDVSLSPDGNKLFFCSKRPTNHPDSVKNDHDIWMSSREGSSWSKPVNLGPAVNSDREDFYPTSAKNGNLYFNSQREKEGTNYIYVSRFMNGAFTAAEKLSPEINIGSWNFDAFIDPDERFLIFSSNAKGCYGGSDLYISFRKNDGSWTPAENLGSQINSSGWELCPAITRDGKYLFFTGTGSSSQTPPEQPMNYSQYYEAYIKPGNGWTDIYWVSSKIIEEFNPKE